MNLRSVRLRLTIVYSIITGLSVLAIAWYAANTGADRIFQSAEREAQQVVANHILDTSIDSDNTWLVQAIDQWVDPRGPVSVEPPYFTLVDRADGKESFHRFELDGTWLALVKPINLEKEEYFIATVFLDDYESDVRSLQWRVGLAALGSILLASVAGWFVAGRSMVPAKKAAQQQRDFIADAAHELRTPLAVIQASASHTLSRDRDAPAYRESLREILQATERASSGVGELLELARLEAGQAKPRTAPLRLDLLIEEVASGVRVDEVVIEARPTAAVVADADYGLLRQIIESLVRNAATRSTHVVLGVTAVDKFALVDVTDNGPGFDVEVLPHVFDRFRRGDTKGSAGLGMAIAKTVVEAHDGSIEASNKPEGGALVRLRLPLGE